MSKKVKDPEPQIGMTAKELIGYLSKLPPKTEIIFEFAPDDDSGIDGISGVAYFPNIKQAILVGECCEISVDDEDLATMVIYGEVGIYDQSKDTEDTCETELPEHVRLAMEDAKGLPLVTGKVPEKVAPRRDICVVDTSIPF